MGRSVSYLSNAQHITYLNWECEEGTEDFAWDDLKESVIECFSKFKTLSQPLNKKWDGRETSIILENAHSEVGISEYCGCVSISIRPIEDDYVKIGLATKWINLIWPKVLKELDKCFPTSHLHRIGGFSNGESVYELSVK
jgi:hypothetical protein